MLTCPKCHSGVPEGMRFCLQCGSVVAPPAPAVTPAAGANPSTPAARAAPVAPPAASAPPATPVAPPRRASPTVPLKIAATPVMAPHAEAAAEPAPTGPGEEKAEVDLESLKKSFEKPVTHPGTVVCRFCKGPLDLNGDFCEQCGAPVMEAAPPGTVKPKPQPAAPPATPEPPPSKPVQAATPAHRPSSVCRISSNRRRASSP